MDDLVNSSYHMQTADTPHLVCLRNTSQKLSMGEFDVNHSSSSADIAPPPTQDYSLPLLAFSWVNLLSLLRHWDNTTNSLRSAQHLRSVYLFVWDSDAAPHLVFHVLLWWSDSGTTRLAEHLSAKLHRYQSDSALPKQEDLCRIQCVHASVSVCLCVND